MAKAKILERSDRTYADLHDRGLRETASELTREHAELRRLLLDAAVAGVVLAFSPGDWEMRENAQKTWERIRALLSRHLLNEENAVIPWAQKQPALPQALPRRLRARHGELRSLVRRVDAVSFAYGSSDEVAAAGNALRALAVKLDDVIDGEEHGFMPVLRDFVFATSNPASTEQALNC